MDIVDLGQLEKKKYKNVVLTIGNFDGIHLGHQKILNSVITSAKKIKGTSFAITFEPHPSKVLYPERGVRTLSPSDEKIRLMAHLGLDVLCFVKFTKDFASIPAHDFIKDVLVDKIGVREVIVGHNYSFGKGKKGTTSLLRRQGRKYGFTVRVIRNARLYGDVASSSRIRSLIGRGRVCEASLFLGRPYMLMGTVIKGAGRGKRLLDTPTANILPLNELTPKEGVYAVKVRVDKRQYEGVMNIGRNPTFSGVAASYEVHIFDFSEDIIGKTLMVYFIDRIRDEKTFADHIDLKGQIKKDIVAVKTILAKKKHPKMI
ncbi:MAG: bifunctional riboflavin kinase/FAD synthetase [Nitrospirae bacterium]|nr:bifunctional riboflavin kinase/FAD synthetase [Nitrospirota bacterium]